MELITLISAITVFILAIFFTGFVVSFPVLIKYLQKEP